MRHQVLHDHVELVFLLAAIYHEITGDDLEAKKAIEAIGAQQAPTLEIKQASMMAPTMTKSALSMIVIESIDYYLYDTSEGFERMAIITRTIGTLLGKLARSFAVPTIVTASTNMTKDHCKYNLSPWSSFTGDSVFLAKCSLKEPNEAEIKRITKPLVQSKRAPFYIDKAEVPIKEYKLRFKALVYCLQNCENTISDDIFYTERTFRNS